MNIPALILGLLAVAFFLFSYWQKKRRFIVLFNLVSRLLYIAQYLLLGAFEGAVLDVFGALSAFVAQKTDSSLVRRHQKAIFISVNAAILLSGVLLYRNVFSLFPMIGVLLQTDALWLKKEKAIRLVSMAGCPFWFGYNFASAAYGSCVGDFLAFLTLGISFVRYDLLGKKEE